MSPRKRTGPSRAASSAAGRSGSPDGERAVPHSRERGADWLYGTHAVLAALANPARRARRLLVTPEVQRGLQHAVATDVRMEAVDRRTIDQLFRPGTVHQGIALLAEPLPELDIDDTCQPEAGRRNTVVVLDQVTDPHNVGAILRSAAAFGARAVVLTDRHAPDATATLAKAASGALETVPLVRVTNLARALDRLAELGYWCIGLAGDADKTLAQIGPDGNIALVLGAEGDGLRRLTTERCDLLARLPISEAVESLNVSNAAAVALYELARA